MREIEPGIRYYEKNALQAELFRKLHNACSARQWAASWLDDGKVEQVLVRTQEGAPSLPVTPQTIRGSQRIIFGLLMTLRDQGHWIEAMDLVASWRVPPSSERDRSV